MTFDFLVCLYFFTQLEVLNAKRLIWFGRLMGALYNMIQGEFIHKHFQKNNSASFLFPIKNNNLGTSRWIGLSNSVFSVISKSLRGEPQVRQ